MTELSVLDWNFGTTPRPEAGQAEVTARQLPNQCRLLLLLGKLLQDAGSAVDRDRNAARDFIARASSLLESKLDHVGDDSASTKLSQGGLAPWQVRRVKGHIEARLTAALRVRDVAQTTQLSTSHFCRAFKCSFGETPHAYIVRRRIERSQEIMLTTEEPLSQIALACGLCDQAHFSRVFRRVVGQTPNEWRRRWAGKPQGRAPILGSGRPVCGIAIAAKPEMKEAD